MGTHYSGTAEQRLALDAYIKLARATESVGASINQHLKTYGLTTSQFGVLEALYHLGPMQVGRLGEKILKSSGNMTLVIDNLAKQGLVERIRLPQDRRCVEVRLTEAGTDLVARILPTHVAGVVFAFQALSTDEQSMLAELCRKLGLAQEQAAYH